MLIAYTHCSPANPSYTTDELVYQLKLTKAALILAHPDVLSTTLAAARLAGIPPDHIALFNPDSKTRSVPNHTTLNELVQAGLGQPPSFVEKRFTPGEARTKLAFLCFSSGTTGTPKVR